MERWTVNGNESTLKGIASIIKTEMSRPVAIIVVGVGPDVEGDFKSRTLEKLRANLQGVIQRTYMCLPSLLELVKVERGRPDVVIVTLDSANSMDHATRHTLVTLLRKHGAKTVVILYTKCKPPVEKLSRLFRRLSGMSTFKREIQMMEANAPTQDGIEYLIVAEETDEKRA